MSEPLETLKPDGFWDNAQGNGVRCSSTGRLAGLYQDTSQARFEGNDGRSVAQCLPTGAGIRGVIIPRATWWGGSRGFDPHKPRLMNIDPDVKGQSSVVDMGSCSKERMTEAFALAQEQVGEYGDPRLVAAQTYRNLAISDEPVGMGPSGRHRDPNLGRPPIAGMSGYVVPKAGLGGGQLARASFDDEPPRYESLVSPSVATSAPEPPRNTTGNVMSNIPDDTSALTTRQLKQAAAQLSVRPAQSDPWGVGPLRKQEPAQEPPPARTEVPAPPALQPMVPYEHPHKSPPLYVPPLFPQGQPQPQPAQQYAAQPMQVQQSAPAEPAEKVTFEIMGWGRMEASFHAVIVSGMLCVFVWDKRCRGGKVFPPKLEPRPDNMPAVAAVLHSTPNKVYYIQSTGQTFEHGDDEYCVCILISESTIGG